MTESFYWNRYPIDRFDLENLRRLMVKPVDSVRRDLNPKIDGSTRRRAKELDEPTGLTRPCRLEWFRIEDLAELDAALENRAL